MAADHFLGIDVGTSGVKAVLVSAAGDVAASATAALRLSTPHPGWAEQDPEAWWGATLAAVRQLLAAHPGARVAAVSCPGDGSCDRRRPGQRTAGRDTDRRSMAP